MAIIPALLSLLTRKLGQLLRAVFGWSITGLFGRVSSAKQTGLAIAMALSVTWPLLVVGVFLPNVAAWGLAFLPLERWLGPTVLRILWAVLAVTAPIIVGAIVHWVAPDRKQKGGRLQTILTGYPLTLGFAISFLITLFVVPALKFAALVKRKRDEHVFVQVREGKYHEVLRRIATSCEEAGVTTTTEPVPVAMGLPLKVMKFFARGGLDPIVADDPKMLRGEKVHVYLYPVDLLLRGDPRTVVRVRAALTRTLMDAPAHLAQDPAAQKIEDEIQRMFEVVRHHEPGTAGAMARTRVQEIARKLDKAEVPYEDWVLLYTNLHHLERAVCGGPRLVDPEPPPHNEDSTMAIQHHDPRAGVSTADLVREALDEAKALIKTEVALAKTEVKEDLTKARSAGIAFGAAFVCAMTAISMLFVALALAIKISAVPALIIGLVLLAVAAVAGFLGYKALPTKPMHQTKERLETDVNIMKEQMA